LDCPFVDRGRELAALDECLRAPCMAVVYGRRRVGKTRLIREWLRGRGVRGVYYLSQLASHQYNLRLMAESAARQLGRPGLAGLRPARLVSLLEALSRFDVEVVVIDEFTYWARSAPLVLSEVQEYADSIMPEGGPSLVITGSLVGVMLGEVLGGGSPLYARARLRLRVDPLGYGYVGCFAPSLGPEDRVRLYALVGGVPFYLCLLRGVASVDEALRALLRPDSPLRGEKDLILREELREPAAYNAVLAALAEGYNTPGKVADATGLTPGAANKALHVLEYLGLVRREVPLFRRKGWYVISDPLLRTWYRLIHPVETLVELGLEEAALEEAASRLDAHTAEAWEELARHHLAALYAPKGYTLIGRLLHKGEEIDVALLNPREGKAVVAEAKWSDLTAREARAIAARLLDKTRRLLPPGYNLEAAYIAARSVEEPPNYVKTITPHNLDTPEPHCQPH
jgi:AAA+ ATPase superfamily predicted ATPase